MMTKSTRRIAAALTLSSALVLTGCGAKDTTENTAAAPENTPATSTSAQPGEKYPNERFIKEIIAINKGKTIDFSKVDLEKRHIAENAANLSQTTGVYSYAVFEDEWRIKAGRSNLTPEETQFGLDFVRDNVDFRFNAIRLAENLYHERSPQSMQPVYNKTHFDQWIIDYRMDEKEEDAARKAIVYYMAAKDMTWQDIADAYAKDFYNSARHSGFSFDELRESMKSDDFTDEEIDNAIAYLEKTV